MKSEAITKDDWMVVEERAKLAPKNFKIAILGKLLEKNDLVKEVQERSEIGQEYADMQLEYIKWCVKKIAG